MRKVAWLLVGALIGGTVVATSGFVFFAIRHSPVVVIANLDVATIPNVRIETDINESYEIGSVPGHSSRRVAISGRDKELWVVAQLPGGISKESEKIYVTSTGIVFAVISNGSVAIAYEI